MREEQAYYRIYSGYLKEKYGEKVYKLPVNLPVTCPNRLAGGNGCAFCAESGTGFEALESSERVTEQLLKTKEKITRKYKARKFIAYFQNYTNTFLPLERFQGYLEEAASLPDIVEISVSTRPDCIRDSYLDVLQEIHERTGVEITIELGLQTANYHTLYRIARGHGLAEYLDSVLRIKRYGFEICTHLILNLPGDTLQDSIETAKLVSILETNIVKLHSLYIAKNTRLSKEYENGTITICSKEEYFSRVEAFLSYLDPSIVVERLFSRIPEKDALFCNWQTSWWKLKDELLEDMEQQGIYQGCRFCYRNGPALDLLGGQQFE
ncbi:MAG TPA: TIGR01212 family radical SAM protein [Lachnospiraceae bacterium]|nr:TIGR01212 family radical SAM protein [Lachnospiraceae bacterium]